MQKYIKKQFINKKKYIHTRMHQGKNSEAPQQQVLLDEKMPVPDT